MVAPCRVCKIKPTWYAHQGSFGVSGIIYVRKINILYFF